MRRRRVLLIAGSLALVSGLAWALRPPSVAAPAWSSEYDVSAPRPELLPAGTVVGDGPPDGWTHLVIKSLPRVRPSERSKVDGLTARMTSWLFTAFVADVRPESQGAHTRHTLRRVGLGVGTDVKGKHTVLFPATARRHGAEMNWITDTILEKAHEAQNRAVFVVHGPTMGVVDTAVWYRCGTANQLVRFRYALLVDAVGGRLDVLLWVLAPPGCRDDSEAVWLNPSQHDPAELIPDKKQFSAFGIPSEAAFGIDRLPPHRAKAVLAPELLPLATRTKFTPDEARELEAALRRMPR